jgi:hypothetical protein
VFTLAEAGIDKNLGHEAKNLERLSEDDHKERIQSACDAVRRTLKNIASERK